MKIFLDTDYKCHMTDDKNMLSVETDFFDNKCKAFIEGYRFIPKNKTWTNEQGDSFIGEAYFPAVPYLGLELEQLKYELANAKAEKIQFEEMYQEGVNSI